MEKVKIDGSRIGLKKNVVINRSVGTEKRAKRIELEIMKAQAAQYNESNQTEFLESALDTVDKMIDYVKVTMKLTEKQVEELEDNVTEEELGSFVGYISSRLRGVSDEEFDEYMKEQTEEVETDPKSEKQD